MGESSELSSPADQPEPQDSEPIPEPTQNPPDDSPKKKKKKKKDKIKEEATEEEIKRIPPSQLDCNAATELNWTTSETDGAEPGEKKKKKKKKKEKHVKEEEEEIEVSRMEIHGSDSSGYLSDKPSKKRKHQTTGLSEDVTPTKSKKKRGDIEQFA